MNYIHTNKYNYIKRVQKVFTALKSFLMAIKHVFMIKRTYVYIYRVNSKGFHDLKRTSHVYIYRVDSKGFYDFKKHHQS